MKDSIKTALIILTTLFLMTGCDSSTTETDTLPGDMTLLGLSQYEQIDLNSSQRESLAYMWNEEKMAYDLYMKLGNMWSIMQMKNIAKKSEIVHMQYVEDLVAWYDINVSDPDFNASYSAEELDALKPGKFTITAVSDLYTSLFNLGNPSLFDSLRVGCMVEVTDVDDLNIFMEQAEGNAALIDTFTILRDGSYNHYWAFHKALKDAGYPEGCAFEYDGVDYNKTGVYPQSM